MRYANTAAIATVLLCNVCSAGEKLQLKDLDDRVNYSVGYQIGGDFKRQGLPMNPEALVKGIQDAIAGTEPLMSQQEMRTTLVELKKRILETQRAEQKKKAEKNLAEALAFLAENGKKEGVKTLPSGLQYRVITEGSGANPKASDSVTVNYRGTLINGTEFDSSYKRNKPATFRVNQVIPGWTEALQLMKVGSKWQLFIPPNLAYGERGAGASIPPDSALIFEVELISIGESGAASGPPKS
jgi:FKBP-type peptidyl-prolyl cis-trans isomerase FklB